jgi:hypothetical protein
MRFLVPGFASFSVAVAVAVTALAACDRGSSAGGGSATSASGSATGTGSATAAASTGTGTVTGKGVAWSGTYKSSAHGFYMPRDAPNAGDWKSITFQGDDAGDGVGEGAIDLQIDPAGKVTGTIAGPVGPATVVGLVADGAFTARVQRKDPSDRGLTGTMEGKAGPDKIDGTMHLSNAEASLIRSAAFSLARK